MQPSDLKVIACNLNQPTKTCVEGALCYVLDFNLSNAAEQVRLLMRSRGGRWIDKYEALKRLKNFRLKTIPPDSPLYERLQLAALPSELEGAQRFINSAQK